MGTEHIDFEEIEDRLHNIVKKMESVTKGKFDRKKLRTTLFMEAKEIVEDIIKQRTTKIDYYTGIKKHHSFSKNQPYVVLRNSWANYIIDDIEKLLDRYSHILSRHMSLNDFYILIARLYINKKDFIIKDSGSK